MKNHIGIVIFAIAFFSFSLSALCGIKDDYLDLENSEFKTVWDAYFLFKPIVSLEDKRANVDTWMLTGKKHDSSMLCVLLADLMITRLGKYSFYPNAQLDSLLSRAEQLKNDKLTEGEKSSVRALQKHIRNKKRRNFLVKSFAPLAMKDIIGNTQDVEKALRIIESENGVLCDHAVSEHPTTRQVIQFLNEGNAIILEKRKTKGLGFLSNDDGMWRLLFAAFLDSGGIQRFLVNIPEETILMEKWPWHGTYDALESFYLSEIYEFNCRRSKDTTYTDVRSLIDNKICNSGFALGNESILGDYRLHALRNWRYSVEAWDGELRKILGLPKENRKTATVPPGEDASSEELWRYFFAERRAEAGLSFEGSLIPTCRIAAGKFTPLEAAMLSAVATGRKDFVGFGLSHPGRLFHTARLLLGNSLLLPKQRELDQCKELTDKVLGEYQSAYGKLPREPYYWDAPEYSSDILERDRPGYKSPHSLQAHLFHSLPQILKGVTCVREAVDRMGPACAWTARVEGGPGTDWETMKLAIWRRIPVILEGRDGDWRTAVAYLVHDGKRLLLATRKQDAAAAPAGPVLKEYELPDELPPELEFIEYDEKRWTPWFAHHFEPTVEHLAPQIVEIFKAHPEAKKYLEAHPGAVAGKE